MANLNNKDKRLSTFVPPRAHGGIFVLTLNLLEGTYRGRTEGCSGHVICTMIQELDIAFYGVWDVPSETPTV